MSLAFLGFDAQVNEIVNDTVNEVFVEFGQECQADVSQEFQLLARNSSKINIGSLENTQDALAVLECAQDSDTQAALATKLTTELKKKFEADGAPALVGGTASIQVSDVENTIKNKFSVIDRQACESAVTQLVKVEATDESEINIGAVVSKQAAEASGECSKISTLAVDIANDISNSISSETKISGPLIALIALISLAIIVGAIVAIVRATRGGKKKNNIEQEQQRQMLMAQQQQQQFYPSNYPQQMQPQQFYPRQQQFYDSPEVTNQQLTPFTQSPGPEQQQQPYELSPSPFY